MNQKIEQNVKKGENDERNMRDTKSQVPPSN